MQRRGEQRKATVVLDDDPTGTQAVAEVTVLLSWPQQTVARILASAPAALHLMTNSRAYPAAAARERTRAAAASARAADPEARLLLRGDSTLRGHLLEEHLAVEEALGVERAVALLVPALPAAGRVTRRGRHLLLDDRGSIPLDQTEFARDHAFSYGSSRLLEWAEERSRGHFDAAAGTEVPLADLRASAGAAVTTALIAAWDAGVPAVCAPDAETEGDLDLIAAGLEAAEAGGIPIVTRCAPTFAGILSGTLAADPIDPPAAGAGVLVVCGSYVGTTTAQLDQLAGQGHKPIIVAASDLASDAATRALELAARAARRELGRSGLAVVATSRERPAADATLDTGLRIACSLAGIVPAVGDAAEVVVAKGGITSAITLQHGLGTDEARVAGPLLPGVALWRAQTSGGERPYVVVPGNVGGPDLLVELTNLISKGRS